MAPRKNRRHAVAAPQLNKTKQVLPRHAQTSRLSTARGGGRRLVQARLTAPSTPEPQRHCSSTTAGARRRVSNVTTRLYSVGSKNMLAGASAVSIARWSGHVTMAMSCQEPSLYTSVERPNHHTHWQARRVSPHAEVRPRVQEWRRGTPATGAMKIARQARNRPHRRVNPGPSWGVPYRRHGASHRRHVDPKERRATRGLVARDAGGAVAWRKARVVGWF